MEIWVDADACPLVIKEILFKAAERTRVKLTLVANQPIKIPSSPHIQFLRVSPGPDVADSEIVRNLKVGDLVITSDIPLAAEVVEKGGFALNPRGKFYSTENIKEHLSTRDFLDNLRSSGVDTGGPPTLSKKHRQSFANNLDRFLSKQLKSL
jgi:uncharacterized protein YaiI (UPF0178 family)